MTYIRQLQCTLPYVFLSEREHGKYNHLNIFITYKIPLFLSLEIVSVTLTTFIVITKY
jgi:hypothetical protein